MTLFSTTSCLVTEDLQARIDPPPAANHPPRIQPDAISPNNWAPVIPDPDKRESPDLPCTVHLEARIVVDEDLTDILKARWFLDWGDTAKNDIKWSGTIDGAPNEDGKRIGGDATRYDYVVTDLGMHLMTLVISDGFADLPGKPATAAVGKDVASVTWTIDSSAATRCPTSGALQ